MLWILLLVYIFNFLDRQIVNILAEPIARDLSLSDTQIGLMTGLAFALFYTVLGIPIARFADRPTTNRVGLISIRSEEHTSELQSLMRISYAVFCLNKKKNINN